jgi:hypothetical protein
MPPYAVQVTMGVSWHGAEEEFSNIFHYDTPTITTDSGWDELANAVVAALRTIHTSNVTFKRVRVHGRTDLSKIEDQMRLVKDLTGVGTMSSVATLPPETAVVADVYVGRGPKGGKQFLRKYIKARGLPGAGATEGMSFGVTALGSAQKTPFVNALNGLKSVSVGGALNDICTPQGKGLPAGSEWSVNPYTSTRQFRRGTKEKK